MFSPSKQINVCTHRCSSRVKCVRYKDKPRQAVYSSLRLSWPADFTKENQFLFARVWSNQILHHTISKWLISNWKFCVCVVLGSQLKRKELYISCCIECVVMCGLSRHLHMHACISSYHNPALRANVPCPEYSINVCLFKQNDLCTGLHILIDSPQGQRIITCMYYVDLCLCRVLMLALSLVQRVVPVREHVATELRYNEKWLFVNQDICTCSQQC